MEEQRFLFTQLVPISFPRMTHFPPLVAILIDGDNNTLSESQLVEVIHEAELLGEVAVRRVYGNWAAETKSAWKELVLKYAFQPCHHIHGLPGKNATDIALSVDTMDLFYTGITIFFLVSGDSDYTPLIQRLRATNCQVIGIGNPAKNASLISACNRFIFLTHPHQEQADTSPKKKVTTTTHMKAGVSSSKKGSTMYQEIGIFINGDNQPPSYLETVVKIASFWGTILVCYVYYATNSHTWQQTCHEYGAAFIPQKRISDHLLAKEAQIKTLQTFFLVSESEDFVRAAYHLQQYGTVIGLGSANAAYQFQEACTSFVPLPIAIDDASLARIFRQEKHQSRVISSSKRTPKKTSTDTKKATITPMKSTHTASVTATSVKVVKPLDDPDLTRKIEQAFASIVTQQGKEPVLLVDVAKALKEGTPLLRARDYGENSPLFLIKARTDLFTFQQIEQDGKKLDVMRRRESSNGGETF